MPTPNKDHSLAAVFGGEPLTVTTNAGETLEVFVRQLPLRLLPTFMGHQIDQDEQALVELYCDQPAHWADTLTEDSCTAVLELGATLNFPRLERQARRRAEGAARLHPLLEIAADGLKSQRAQLQSLAGLAAKS